MASFTRSWAAENSSTALASPFSGDNDLVFPNAVGDGCCQTVARRILRSALKDAGIKTDGDKGKVRFHDLRHTFASLLIANGTDVVYASRQLGHASPTETLKTYSHLFDAARQAERTSAALEAQFGGMLGNTVETPDSAGEVSAVDGDSTDPAPVVALGTKRS